jgi:hypothetical protein
MPFNQPEEKSMKTIHTLLLALCLPALPALAQEQFTYTTNNGTLTITGCTNAYGNYDPLVIPDTIHGLPVVSIAYYACAYKSTTNVTIGNNVTNLGPYAFWSCIFLNQITIPKNVTSLGGSALSACGGAYGNPGIKVFFQGDKPAMDGGSAFINGILYRVPGTHGWADADAVLWNPTPQTGDGHFGVRTNAFGFNITGTPDIPVVVEAATNLSGVWTPLQSASLTNGSLYFSDPQWPAHPAGYYRIRSP